MLAECCDVMVAHSPPLFASAHNAQPELSVLYQNLRLVMTHKQQSPLSVRRFNNRSGSNSPDRQTAKPRRPCLVVKTDSDGSIGSSSGSSSDENEPSSPTRTKKKVVFADDRGLSLTQVRLMNEPSNQPPKLMTVSPFLNQQSSSGGGGSGVRGCGPAKPNEPPQWQLRFPQPASSYVDFRKRLDVNNVSLENVIVKSPERRIVGTVKVRNLSYDKEVFVRSTEDQWVTHRDTACTYVQNNAAAAAAVNGGGAGCGSPAAPAPNVTAIYDTFAFRLPLPVAAPSMEFAVCYKSPLFECWDNNDGHNYRMSLVGAPQPPSAAAELRHPSPGVTASSGAATAAAAKPGFVNVPVPKPSVHYFGAQSRQNSWSNWRDHKNDAFAYW